MKVQIEGDLYLESDSIQFIIKEYTGKLDKQGNETYKTIGYYASISSAIRHLVKMKVMESTATTLNELLNSVKKIEEYIKEKVSV